MSSKAGFRGVLLTFPSFFCKWDFNSDFFFDELKRILIKKPVPLQVTHLSLRHGLKVRIPAQLSFSQAGEKSLASHIVHSFIFV